MQNGGAIYLLADDLDAAGHFCWFHGKGRAARSSGHHADSRHALMDSRPRASWQESDFLRTRNHRIDWWREHKPDRLQRPYFVDTLEVREMPAIDWL